MQHEVIISLSDIFHLYNETKSYQEENEGKKKETDEKKIKITTRKESTFYSVHWMQEENGKVCRSHKSDPGWRAQPIY